MKIIVSAGGTGGHLYPALALVEYIKTQDIKAEFLFVGTTDRLESQVVPQKGYAYKGLKVKDWLVILYKNKERYDFCEIFKRI